MSAPAAPAPPATNGSTPAPPPPVTPQAGGKKRSAWMTHVKATMKAHKGKSLSEVLKMAKKTYKKSAKGGRKTRKTRKGGRKH